MNATDSVEQIASAVGITQEILEIIQPPGCGRCRQCGAEFDFNTVLAYCQWRSTDIEWLSGEQLKIKSIELN
jgi:hydrogenase nickel incorporation protein HypA/HybF